MWIALSVKQSDKKVVDLTFSICGFCYLLDCTNSNEIQLFVQLVMKVILFLMNLQCD
jgi:hypothetical protein